MGGGAKDVHEQEVVGACVIDRTGQTWNFPMRCEDGIHLATAVVLETLPEERAFNDGSASVHRMLFLETTSSEERRQPGTVTDIYERHYCTWDQMSSWTRLA
jgi:hypothetical protein